MRSALFTTVLPDGKQVSVAPVSKDTFEANQAHELGDDSGYFIYEYDTERPSAGIEILAKAASYQAAVRLVDIYVIAVLRGQELAASNSWRMGVSSI